MSKDLNRDFSQQNKEDDQTVYENVQHHQQLANCKVKPQLGIISHLVEWLLPKVQEIRSIVEEFLCIVSGNIKS